MMRPKLTRIWHLCLLALLLFANSGVNLYSKPLYAKTTAVDASTFRSSEATQTDVSSVEDTFSPQASAVPWVARHGLTNAQYQEEFDTWGGQGFRLISISGYAINNEARYAAVWIKSNGPAWVARHGISAADYQTAFTDFANQGYRLVQVTGFALNNEARYNAIWELRNDGIAWVARHGLNAADYQAAFTDFTNQGYRPVMVNGFSLNDEARYSAIWDKSAGPAWVARHGITAAEYQTTFTDLNNQGFRPVQTSGFSINNEARYIALWEQRGSAAWVARHGISATDYQALVDDLGVKGYRPLFVTGFPQNNEARFSTVWEQTVEPFSDLPVTGDAVPELAAFDQTMKTYMIDRQITAGTLAVMKDGNIVFERGYGWKDRERTIAMPPDAMLRLASIVKPLTAAAINNLIVAGQLAATDRVFCLTGSPSNCILNITPFGTEDSRAVDITVQNLLDHKGGWDRDISGDPMFKPIEIADDLGVTSPPTKQQIAEYMLGQPLDHTPGATFAYSNFGYLLLGLIIEDVTGQSYTSYIQNSLLAPLCIPKQDIQLGHSLPGQRNPREPWYSDPNTASNVFDSSQTVMFPDGGYYIEAMEAHGGLIASSSAMIKFLKSYWISGQPRTDNSEGWTFFGSLPGTHTMARQRNDGVNIVALFNQRTDPSGLDYNLIMNQMDAAVDGITTWPTVAQVAQSPDANQQTSFCLFARQKIFVDVVGSTLLKSLDEKTSVVFPEAVAPTPLDVTFTPKSLAVGGNFQAINQFFELDATDPDGQPVTSFDNPITIVSELPSDLGGMSADQFKLYWLDGSTWRTDGLSTVSLVGNTLTSTTTHFTTFAVLAEIPDEEEPVDEEPVDEEPVDEEPVDEEPVDEEPVDEEPVDEEPEQQPDRLFMPVVRP